MYLTAWQQQQQQQGQAGASGKGQGQGQGQQPPQQHYYPYWPGYQHPHHAAAYHAQQQQLATARGGQSGSATAVLPVAHQGKGQGNINCAQAVIERRKVKGTKKEFAPPKNIQSNKQHRRMDSKSSKSLSVSSSVGTVASLSKKRSREESFDEGRDDLNTKSLSLSEDDPDDNVSTSGLSLGGFSLGSLGECCDLTLFVWTLLLFIMSYLHIRLPPVYSHHSRSSE